MTNNKLTGLGANHPANGPLTTERLIHIRDVLQRKLKYSNGGSMDYIIADAVKAIDELLAGRKAEPVGEVVLGEYDDSGCHPDARVVCIAADGQAYWGNFKDGTRLYATTPAPVTIDERAAFNAWNNEDNLPIAGVGAKNAAWLAWQARARLGSPTAPVVPDECPVEIRDLMASHSDALFHDGDAQEIWNACRAAMLNHSGDVIEMREAIKQQSTMQPNNGAMSGDAVKQSSSNAQRR
ncbi:hypothetical protein OGV87_09955 [Citrobacter sp. CK183]|uniref:hypothetical protein n=1 Tax=Citrobacter sp. CK183 TaxID=2985092 RepID=UPI002577C8CC|nr:hypothetical protein [Citrobacter sp. CK183]MDM3050920.1 hypothetical protein [Citrobacter sp. CK183]